ncbi:hypothetical protein BKA67DRAFT_148042 [Truncatella angustata]|uniref:Uncharacterized protein n=1 Tax=Truncatella angustata TaxID=152316 RepID=A0A9P8ZYM3_9PEZI|nr:uncharacterized protein BKA67DRAFT_148042 [Truncatella angustata]KAH6656207.1 hypothetical protein BKA67DRAFT_148042 [Truncatella angustata]
MNIKSAKFDGAVPSRRRVPLAERSNTVSPRRFARWSRKNSDVSASSRHDSLYDAECLSATRVQKVSPRPIQILPYRRPKQIEVEDLRTESPLSRLETTPFIYGHGTALHPISEQLSVTTLRTASYATSDVSSLMHNAPGPLSRADGNRTIHQPLRNRQSYSHDDINCAESSVERLNVTVDVSVTRLTGEEPRSSVAGLCRRCDKPTVFKTWNCGRCTTERITSNCCFGFLRLFEPS